MNGKYFIAVFGVIERSLLYKCKPLNYGNIVALISYNPSNQKDDICILTRANKSTKRCLFVDQ
jgi:hypothetical protein